jgi:uncharacterized protein
MEVHMSRKLCFATLMIIGILLVASCSPKQATPTPEANMPNPASVFCEQNGGKLDIRTASDGSQSGVCVFADGSECDEWAYFRGECKPGTATSTPSAGMPNPASVFCEQNKGKIEIRTAADGGQSGVCTFADGSECDEWAYLRAECKPGEATATAVVAAATALVAADDGWKTYQNKDLGYSFQYPGDATIETADDPLKTLTISGPLAAGEHWPQINISHPTDREDYRPPEGTDLEKWLIDHNLLMAGSGQPTGEARQADTQIAGTTAIHTRHARSPQSYAYDKYYFARGGQLYIVVILHVGDREDWGVYERFLASIRFGE